MLSLMSGNWVLFQAGSVHCVGIGLFMWSMSSEYFLSSICNWWMKLLHFSLPLVEVYTCSPVSVSNEWVCVNLKVPVMILVA